MARSYRHDRTLEPIILLLAKIEIALDSRISLLIPGACAQIKIRARKCRANAMARDSAGEWCI
jgi:hypothetical protein